MKRVGIPHFIKKYQYLGEDIRKNSDGLLDGFRLISVFILPIPLLIFINSIINLNQHPEGIVLMIPLIPILGWWGSKVFIGSGIKIYTDHIFNIVNSIQTLSNTINDYIEQKQTIEEILLKVEYINKLNKAFLSMEKKIQSNINFRKRYGNLINESLEWIFSILSDLRSDLSIRLSEQQKTLEQAKSEVEQNIHGTSELERVSELQRARLDKQIEQFEELQRVLVKV